MIVLHDFFRSSASYRVRIALNLKGLGYERREVNFRSDEQSSPAFLAINPQGLVPALEIDGLVLTQSLAIIDYLDTRCPEPLLVPSDAAKRAFVHGLALTIACDIHPIDNLRVLTQLRERFDADEEQVSDWYRHWLRLGLDALEAQLARHKIEGFLGEFPGLFEICLVPQLYNARRYALDLSPYARLVEIDSAARDLPAFAEAAPENFAPAG